METEKRFRIALIFSLPLLVLAMGPMLGLTLPENLFPGFSAKSGSWLQFFLTLPVMFAGRDFYLRGLPSLWREIRTWIPWWHWGRWLLLVTVSGTC